jgi:Ca-activated chloride channel family protein
VLEVAITDLVATYTLRHHLRNDGKSPVEIVYTFPVPLDAAFLGLRATIAGETMGADVRPRATATRDYDDAIADGHSAVLLEQPAPGVLTASFGNLKPGEEGEITLRFAAPLRVAGGSARFSLPLVHRPRYGHWRMDEPATPRHDFAETHPLSLSVRVQGLLAAASARCASHPAAFTRQDGELVLALATAELDRDLVLLFDLDAAHAPAARCIVDGEDSFGLASVVVPLDGVPALPLDLVLLLDGSGSMHGDAIAQSRAAVHALAAALDPADRIQAIRFGSSARPLFRRMLKATPQVTAALAELAGTVDADLGGTEMEAALHRALQHLPDAEAGRRRAIILVTDGAVQPEDIAGAKDALRDAAVPCFVAVGSAAGVDVLEPLASDTSAALERAVAMEPIDACVMRHLQRARRAPVTVQASWEGVDAEPVALPLAFPGDVLQVAAHWRGITVPMLRLATSASREPLSLMLLPRAGEPALRAILGQRRHAEAAPGRQLAMALRYGLLTDSTSAVLVRTRAEGDRVDELPAIVPVAQMVPHGMVASSAADFLPLPAFLRRDASGEQSGVYVQEPLCSMRLDGDLTDAADPIDDLFGGERETPAAAPAPDSPVIPPGRVEEVLAALFAVLRHAWLGEPAEPIDLEAAMTRLPETLREDARRIVERISPSDSRSLDCTAATLCLMADYVSHPPLSDEEEARLAMLQAVHAVPAITQELEDVLRCGLGRQAGVAC